MSTNLRMDETYVKMLGKWHHLYRGIDRGGQVLDWLSRARDLAAAEAFFQPSHNSTGCSLEHVVTDKAGFYPSAIRSYAPVAKDSNGEIFVVNELDGNQGTGTRSREIVLLTAEHPLRAIGRPASRASSCN